MTCPANMVVEFATTQGATAAFSLVTTEPCSTVTSACVPPSGSLFPIGTTTVQCTASDGAGNQSQCSFTVTVLGSQGTIEGVLADLIALQGGGTALLQTGASSPNAQTMLADAIQHLENALLSGYWRDETHLDPTQGDEVFRQIKGALHELQALFDNESGISEEQLQGYIDRLLKACRLLAEVEIQDAAKAGLNPKKVAEDMAELARGDEAAAKGQIEPAIEHYRNAWKHALHLLVKATKNGNGDVHLEFVGATANRYEIQASSNLVDWVTIGTATPNADDVVEFEDTDPGKGKRYYRAAAK